MPNFRRVSASYSPISHTSSGNPVLPVNSRSSPIKESSEFLALCQTLAHDLVDEKLIEIDMDVSVDTACDSLIINDIPCIAVRAPANHGGSHTGLFDCSDVNAFLTLAATSHLLRDDDADARTTQILEAAKSGTGKVPVKFCTDLSEKNPLCTLPGSANILSLLTLFSRGTHRAIIESPNGGVASIVSDAGLVSWIMMHASTNTAVASVLAQPLSSLGIGSREVISCISSDSVLDAMKLMSEQGVSSVAVMDPESSDLLFAVSVTDISRLVVPSQSKKILSTSLGQFISLIKAPGGSQDGIDRYPVFSVSQNATLSLVIQKLLATNSQRVFMTDDPAEPLSPLQGNLRGVVSVVDVLSVFAQLAGIPDVDPTSMQRHRRASSASSTSSRSASGSRVSRGSRSSHSSVSNLEREGRQLERK